MGKINQGILGGFRNKVGTVVGYFRYGDGIMRGLAGQVTNPRTPKQEAARARFSLITLAINACLGFTNVFFDQVGSRTRQNSAVSRNLTNGCIQGSGTTVNIDYSMFELSQGGNGLNPTNIAAVQGTGHTIDISWTDNTGVSPETLSSDIVCACFYNPARRQSVSDVNSASRLDAALTLSYPAIWAGEEVHVYIATRNISGSLKSPSYYAGAITVS